MPQGDITGNLREPIVWNLKPIKGSYKHLFNDEATSFHSKP